MKCHSANVTQATLQSGGIPNNLAINVPVFVGLFLFFCLFWRQRHSGFVNLPQKNSNVLALRRSVTSLEDLTRLDAEEERLFEPTTADLSGKFSWILPLLRMPDHEVSVRCGIDAAQYLNLLRNMLKAVFCMMLLNMTIVLPVNYTASENYPGFSRTTISNIPHDSARLWVHVVFLYVNVGLVLYFLQRHRLFVARSQSNVRKASDRSLLITNVPTWLKSGDRIADHFHGVYPDSRVIAVELARDVRDVLRLAKKLEIAKTNFSRAKAIRKKKGIRPTTRVGGVLCFGGSKVDAENYWKAQTEACAIELTKKRRSVLSGPNIGMAFVSFADKEGARRVLDDFLSLHPLRSHQTSALRTDSWQLQYAAHPRDVEWTNLTVGPWERRLRFLIVNGGLIVLLLFYTTPLSIVTALQGLRSSDVLDGVSKSTSNNPILTSYLPTVLLLLLGVALPWIVGYTAWFEAFHTKSSFAFSCAVKSFAFTLTSVLILPSIALTSVDAIIQISSRDDMSVLDKLECVFLPDDGAFFVTLTITAGFLGTGVELLRLWDWLCYQWLKFRAVTEKEMKNARRVSYDTFDYGMQYPLVLTMFCVILVFSSTCPIILLFGLCYCFNKMLVDKYNLVLGKPATFHTDGTLVTVAGNFVIACTGVYSAYITGYFVLKQGWHSAHAGLSLLCFLGVCIVAVLKRRGIFHSRFGIDRKVKRVFNLVPQAEGAYIPDLLLDTAAEELLAMEDEDPLSMPGSRTLTPSPSTNELTLMSGGLMFRGDVDVDEGEGEGVGEGEAVAAVDEEQGVPGAGVQAAPSPRGADPLVERDLQAVAKSLAENAHTRTAFQLGDDSDASDADEREGDGVGLIRR